MKLALGIGSISCAATFKLLGQLTLLLPPQLPKTELRADSWFFQNHNVGILEGICNDQLPIAPVSVLFRELHAPSLQRARSLLIAFHEQV